MEASVSVIIPCYRCASTIRMTVDSVAKQTLHPAKLILVNDASDDATLEVLQALQNEYGDNWIEIITLTVNSGPSVARNIGWDLAISDYIAFLDADDLWHPQKIDLQYSWMVNHPHVAVSGHHSEFIESVTSLKITANNNFNETLISSKKILCSNPFTTPSIMLKRNLTYRFNAYKKYCEDYLLLMQIGLDGYLIYKLNISLTYVIKSETSLSHNRWLMRTGDLSNYWRLWQEKRIGLILMSLAITYSLIKFSFLMLTPALRSVLKRSFNRRFLWLSS